MAYSQFNFVKSPTGTLSGESFVQQTEDAINSLVEQVFEVVNSNENIAAQVQQALSTANSAQSTASSALTISESTQQQLETLNITVSGYDQKITQAVSQSTSAVQTATVAQTSAQQAQEAAQQAQTASEQSASQAQQAQEAAQTAQQQAEAAQTSAEAAQDQAENAANTAQNAQEQAQNAQQSAENAAASAAQISSSSVVVTEQTWSDEQQAQARTNIGAAASADATLPGTTSAETLTVSETVTATGGFVGNLTGTASQATADGNGNNIASTYATIANTYTKAQVDAKVSSVYRIMGSVASYDDLPSSGQTVGDVYNVLDTGANYVWTSSGWDKLSETVDLSGYLTISSAQGTYLTIANAQSTYLSQTTAASTYLTQASAQSLYLPVTGGTLTGALILAADPTTPLGAATKQYVDSAVSTGSSNAVLFTVQSLSEQQQQQACTNINAMPAADLIAVCNEIAGVS